MRVALKFQCKATDSVNAMGKYGGVQNCILESDDDAKGIINCLLGIIDAPGRVVKCSESIIVVDCDLEGETILVKLEANDRLSREDFVNCAKKLQELISSTAQKGV